MSVRNPFIMILSVVSILIISNRNCYSQIITAELAWSRTYGGNKTDGAYSVEQTSEGGYIIAGWTASYGAGGSDVYLIKTDPSGKQEWSKTFGGSAGVIARSIQQTLDGGYIVVGNYASYSDDVYLLKTDSSGNEEWSKTFGGSHNDNGYSVQQTSDGGYIIAGNTASFGAYPSDIYLIKTNSSGNEEWSKILGGPDYDYAYSVQQTADGGYIVAGSINSTFWIGDSYLLKLDSLGNSEWLKTFDVAGVDEKDEAYSVQQTPDDGYIIAGMGERPEGAGYYGYLIKTDSFGNKEWERALTNRGDASKGGSVAYSVQQTIDAGYIVGGYFSSLETKWDFYLVKTDSIGNVEWSKNFFGDNRAEKAYSVQQTSDGGFIIAGFTGTWDLPDSLDVLLIKLCIKGDVNKDGYINISDIISELRTVIGVEALPSRPDEWCRSDFDDNGTIDILDIIKILRTVLGL